MGKVVSSICRGSFLSSIITKSIRKPVSLSKKGSKLEAALKTSHMWQNRDDSEVWLSGDVFLKMSTKGSKREHTALWSRETFLRGWKALSWRRIYAPLWNLNVYHAVRNSPPLALILSQSRIYPTSSGHILILSCHESSTSHPLLPPSNGLSLRVSQLRFCMHFSIVPMRATSSPQ